MALRARYLDTFRPSQVNVVSIIEYAVYRDLTPSHPHPSLMPRLRHKTPIIIAYPITPQNTPQAAKKAPSLSGRSHGKFCQGAKKGRAKVVRVQCTQYNRNNYR